jgi:hypothetical protein
MLRQVIRELDDLAISALTKGDHRACIDARKQKSAAIQVLMQQEQPSKPHTSVNGKKTIDYSLIDEIVSGVKDNYDPCPHCGAYSIPNGRYRPKATGDKSGNA